MDNVAELDELPKLTPKQNAFVSALLEGKNASDAYRQAYNCENMSRQAIWVEASRLCASPKVALWLRHFQRIGMDGRDVVSPPRGRRAREGTSQHQTDRRFAFRRPYMLRCTGTVLRMTRNFGINQARGYVA
jgi:hypothetical protein